jgi:RNA polymerase sigma-70 factor (ECF subfamily)
MILVLSMLSLCSPGPGDAVSPRLLHNAGVVSDTAQRPRPGDATVMAFPATAEQSQQRTDAELVQRCLRGDRQAFHDLTVRYYRPVGAFIFKRVQRPDVVEDLAQETFLEAYRSLKAGRPPQHFSSWLFGIAVNCCGKWLRRKRPVLFDATDPPDTTAVPSFTAEHEEWEEQQRLLAALEDGLAGLPEQTRTLLSLKHRQGKTCEEIATELGQPVGTIKSQLSRAYKALRERLGRRGDQTP